MKKLLLASPRGFCIGVKRAVEALNNVLKKYPNQKIYCYHQIVHNTHAVKDFQERGVVFVDSLDEIPPKSLVVFSAHGVSPQMIQQAKDKDLRITDATCPFVQKTHYEVKKYAQDGYQIIYLGQASHNEVVGTISEALEDVTVIQNIAEVEDLKLSPDTKLALVTQTTLSYDDTYHIIQALKQKYPNLTEPAKSDICQATQNRQNGVKELVKQGAEVVIVLGSANSSNSNKLKKVAEQSGVRAFLLDSIEEMDLKILSEYFCIGLTAGASLPEEILTQAINWFKNQGCSKIEEVILRDREQKNLTPVRIC